MELKVKEAYPGDSEILPELKFQIELIDEEERDHSFFYQLSGYLEVGSGEKIAYLNEYEPGPGRHSFSVENHLDQDKNKEREITRNFLLTASLSNKALDKIEEAKDKDPNNDVNFTLKVMIKRCSVRQSNENFIEEISYLSKIEGNEDVRIPHSEWENKYAEKLGMGKTLTVDIKIPDEETQNNAFFENFEQMRNYLEKMNEDLIRGEWKQVIDNAREFYEATPLYRKESNELKDQFRDNFQSRNGTNLGSDYLIESINKLYDYLSKFKHSRNQKGENQIKPIPQKEDAYLAYSLSVGFFNLFQKKTS